MQELRETRQVGSEITSKGAALYDLLGRELELRRVRQVTVSRLDTMDAEAVRRSIAARY